MANRYWVGGTASWDGTAGTKWALTSGGAGGQAVPTSSDDVFFDGASGAVTVTVAATANCLSLNFTGFTGTFAGSSALNIAGSLTLAAGMTRTYSGTCTMTATSGTKTITSNGKAWTSGTMAFNGSGGTFQLIDQYESVGNLTLTAGTFDANGQTVLLNGLGTTNTITGAFTFFNLTKGGTSGGELAFSANVSITGTFSITQTVRIMIRSTTYGTARTLTVATNALQYADIRDITAAGAANWNLSGITGLSGDCGGNTGITFTTPITVYWVGGTGNWSTAAEWASSSGGTPGTGRVPLPQDTARFDGSSFSGGSQTVSIDQTRICAMDWTGATNTPTLDANRTIEQYGSLTLISGMNWTSRNFNWSFFNRGAAFLDLQTKDFGNNMRMDCLTGSITLSSNFQANGRTLTLLSGTFDANDFDVTASFNGTVQAAMTVFAGNGTWYATSDDGVGQAFGVNSSATWNAEGSTIRMISTSSASNHTFAGGGKTYNIVWFDNGNATTDRIISGSNTIAELKDTGTVSHSLKFTAATTQRITTWSIAGAPGLIISINSTTTGIHTLIKEGVQLVSADYLNIQHSVAQPNNIWYAGENSVNNQFVATAGSGWQFASPNFSAKNRFRGGGRPASFAPGHAR